MSSYFFVKGQRCVTTLSHRFVVRFQNRVFEKCFLAQSYFALLANAESITFERRIKKKKQSDSNKHIKNDSTKSFFLINL